MNKILYLIIFILFLTNSSYSEEANSHGGALELPESARPNDATISLFEERKKIKSVLLFYLQIMLLLLLLQKK